MERYGFGPAPRRLRAQLRLDYADGSHEWVVTGPDWRLGASPILKSDIYNGETIDARLNTPGWDSPAFDAATWNPATVGAEPPVRLVAQTSPLLTADRSEERRVGKEEVRTCTTRWSPHQ